MEQIYHNDGNVYHQLTNNNNSVTLFEADSRLPLLTFTTDYKVFEIPSCEQIGKISFEGDYLVFLPVTGKPLRPYRLTVTPENIKKFHASISRWWLEKNRPS